ncbi:hypothetical protein OPKNFCMD_3014 [Methylobacterium crusticola]|uniref:Uncharacterized protein n=1 Tax=Methylobacterium crusticola TaxID=1697972 RepID=A0ABQ4QYZ6_9HYPH|nr:hypothetical protein [Methylobacterium crusticola]GJD50276.1 hypothetical protein OPKNFCMD_3014 [Methylobacterium crusticola]
MQRRFGTIERYDADRELDRLMAALRRLLAHRGYVRGEIVSEKLKRLLPQRGAAVGWDEVRARLRTACSDQVAFDYIARSVQVELDLAHGRIVQGR